MGNGVCRIEPAFKSLWHRRDLRIRGSHMSFPHKRWAFVGLPGSEPDRNSGWRISAAERRLSDEMLRQWVDGGILEQAARQRDRDVHFSLQEGKDIFPRT